MTLVITLRDLVVSGVIFLAGNYAVGFARGAIRDRRDVQKARRRFHTSRNIVGGHLRAPGKQFEISPRAERNRHDD